MAPTPTLNPTASVVRAVDTDGRVSLPAEFAGCTVVVESFGGEVRIRKSDGTPEPETVCLEERLRPLSDRDRDIFLALLDNPPEPTEALKAAVADYKRRYG